MSGWVNRVAFLLSMAGVCTAAAIDLPSIPSDARRRTVVLSSPTVPERGGTSMDWMFMAETMEGVERCAFDGDFDLPDAPSADFIPTIDLLAVDIPEGMCVAAVELVPERMPDASVPYPILSNSESSDVALIGFDALRLDGMVNRQLLAGLTDGSLSPRLPQWRPRLLSMLVRGGPLDFDAAFDLLLGTFPGANLDEQVAALDSWASGLTNREAADVYRAETRYWLRVGNAARAVAAANRMEVAHPDYRVRACRLRAVAYANEGAFARARAALAVARAENPSPGELAELLYLGAWIDLQDGQEAAARRALLEIVTHWSGEPVADRARRVLSTLAQEVDE